MASNEEEYRPESYYIPPNFTDAGGVLGGRIGKRNAIELFLLCGPLGYIEYKLLPVLFSSAQTIIIIAMFTLVPLAALCVFGIGGESLSQHAFAFFRFRKKRRVLHYREFSVDKEKIAGAESKIDRFFEDVASYGLVKALTNISDSNSRTAIDADRFSRKGKEQNDGKGKFKSLIHSKPSKSKRKESKSNQDDIDAEYADDRYEKVANEQYDASDNYESDTSYYGNYDDYDETLSASNRRSVQTIKRKPKKKKKSFAAGIISSANAERILRALELGDDDEDY